MRRAAVLWTALTALAALAAAARAAPPLGPRLDARRLRREGPVRVDFDWAPPCRVPVRRVVEWPAPVLPRSSEMTFDLAISAAGDGLRVAIERPALVAIDGGSPERAVAPRVVGALAEGALWTAFAVSREGRFSGAIDVDSVLAPLLEGAPLPAGAPEREELRLMLASTAGRERLRQEIEGEWNDWAGAWAGLRLAPGKTVETQRSIPHGAQGGKIRVRGRVAILGELVTDPEALVLELVETVAPADARTLLGATRTASWRRRVVVAVDPALGRARRVRAVLSVDVDGKKREEIRDVALDWRRAEGCSIRALADVDARYREQPLYLVLEAYALAAIGELPPERDRATREMVKKLIGGGDDWRHTVQQVIGLAPELDDDIRARWRIFQRAAKAQGKPPDLEAFARQMGEELADD